MIGFKNWISLLSAAMILLMSNASARAGTSAANVSINANAPLVTIPDSAFGANTAVWDAPLLDGKMPTLLKQVDVSILRFPDGVDCTVP